ncbi:hypothetical protein QA596_03250 [Balneolales bacterium ANBcel1]|nr:hypothetical protein [Balneolales bacterium ANBcel1]
MRHSQKFPFCAAYAVAAVLFLVSCDSADGPVGVFDYSPVIEELEVHPRELTFTGEDGVRDTTITISISAKSDLPEDSRLVARIYSLQESSVLASDTLLSVESDPRKYRAELQMVGQTSSFDDLVVYVFPQTRDQRIGDRVETRLRVRWENIGEPEILSLEHPQSVRIPAAGQTNFNIIARVGHPHSLDFIQSVRLELYDSARNRIFASQMGSQSAGIYVQNFSVNQNNRPDTYTVEVQAVNVLGIRSDTLRSTFEFVE